MDRPLSAPGAALVPALLLQAPPVAGLGVELWAGAALGALLPQPEPESEPLPDLAEPGALGEELLPQPEDELLLGLAGAAGAEGVEELLQPELLPLEDDEEDLPPLEKDDEDLPLLEEDDLLLLARAGWPPRTRARAKSRKSMRRALRVIPGPP